MILSKHTRMWLRMVATAAEASNCPRRKFGALLVNPEHNIMIAHGYNGAPRGGTKLCRGNDTCARTDFNIQSGQKIEIGCIHAEMNAICNAARAGISTVGTVCYCNGAPCLMCAKLLYQAGIVQLTTIQNDYDPTGRNFLIDHGVSYASYPVNLIYDE